MRIYLPVNCDSGSRKCFYMSERVSNVINCASTANNANIFVRFTTIYFL